MPTLPHFLPHLHPTVAPKVANTASFGCAAAISVLTLALDLSYSHVEAVFLLVTYVCMRHAAREITAVHRRAGRPRPIMRTVATN